MIFQEFFTDQSRTNRSEKYRVIHKGCDFIDYCRAFIQSFKKKTLAVQQFTDCNHVCNINHKPLQGLYTKGKDIFMVFLVQSFFNCYRKMFGSNLTRKNGNPTNEQNVNITRVPFTVNRVSLNRVNTKYKAYIRYVCNICTAYIRNICIIKITLGMYAT